MRALVFLLAITAAAENWPSFRGPSAAGVAGDANLPTTWDAAKGTGIQWKTPIPGLAHSSPIVWEDHIFVTTAVSGKPAARQGNRSAVAAPSNIYRCSPGGPNDYVFIHCATVEMWKSLTKILGRPELGADPRYEDRRDRVAFVDQIDAMIEEWTATRSKQEVLAIVAGAGVPCGAVLDSAEVLSDPHLRQRGFITDLEHPRRGVYPMPGNPVRLSDSPTEMVRSPLLGEHNAEVFGKLLGYGEAEIETLRRDGVI